MKPSRFRRRQAARHPPPPRAAPPTPTTRAHLVAAEPALRDARPVGHWAGDEEAWPARALAAWQVGDWLLLASLGEQPLHRHTQRARLALLAGAGHSQLGEHAAARRLLELSLAWGCDRQLAARVLIGGVFNTLGRAASVLDEPARALTHFTAAMLTASPRSALRSTTQARAGMQLAQLGLGTGAPELDLPVKRAEAHHALGEAGLAGSAAATLAAGEWQYFAFPVRRGALRMVQRRLPAGTPVWCDQPWDVSAPPALGADADGRLRVAFRAGDAIHVRHAAAPHAIDAWLPAVTWPRRASPVQFWTLAGTMRLLVRADGGEQPWHWLADDGTCAAVVPLGASTRHACISTGADGRTHLLGWNSPAYGARHAVSSDGGRRWHFQDPLPPLPAVGDRRVRVRSVADGALLAIVQAGWITFAAGGRAAGADAAFDVGDGQPTVLAVDASSLPAHGQVSVLAVGAGADGALLAWLHDFRIE